MSSIAWIEAPNGDPIAMLSGWRASFISVGALFVLAAQKPNKKMLYGLTPETGFLVGQHVEPTKEQIETFLRQCMSSKIVEKTLEALLGPRKPT